MFRRIDKLSHGEAATPTHLVTLSICTRCTRSVASVRAKFQSVGDTILCRECDLEHIANESKCVFTRLRLHTLGLYIQAVHVRIRIHLAHVYSYRAAPAEGLI
uniref:Uncharacterized protein n=1 Tax=Trichogramma kaykai TaxID=54128 RepID=A0ABD2W541_9HYME